MIFHVKCSIATVLVFAILVCSCVAASPAKGEKTADKAMEAAIQVVQKKCKVVNPVDQSNRDLLDVLVNKSNMLDKTFIPDELVTVDIPFGESVTKDRRKMRKDAARALEKMVATMKKSKLNVIGISGYRSFQSQLYVLSGYVKTKGFSKANRTSACPGQSEHQTGLAMDIGSTGNHGVLGLSFGKTNEYKWIIKNADQYGFIIRYPLGKEKITGYSYEPWHLRYVGTKLAGVLKKNKWTLEEYYGDQDQDLK